MEIVAGLRVVRGPGWKWGEQDGGEGWVGTTVDVDVAEFPVDGKTLSAAVVVQWDNGNRCNYRCGVDGQYDLRVFDSAPIGVKHRNVVCDSCRQSGIIGLRWKCCRCLDFDLCTQCYNHGKHSLDHGFIRIDGEDRPSTPLSPRVSSRRLMAKGLFPGAEVLRGHDWLWGDQDGGIGKLGRLLDIKGNDKDNNRSVGEVEWRETRKRNVYRIGHRGKVDLKCKEAAGGGHYYPDHLPVLGEPYKSPPAPTPHGFHPGDRVRVQLDPDIFKLMQEGHGGWSDDMAECLGEAGTVQSVVDSGDLRVSFPSTKTYTINADSVVKVTELCEGDPVRILDDIASVHNFQEGHGGWVDDMALSLGQVGRILKVFPTGDVRVAVNGRTWTYNPLCMALAPGETPPDLPTMEMESDDIGLQLKMLSLLDNPAVIVAAAAAGDTATLRDFLQKHPKDVNARASGKAAIHCAAVAGNLDVLKVLLDFKADLELEDEDGDRPLHLCAFGDEDEATQLLIDRGASVNSKNHKGATPLIIAAVKGHHSVLRILANHPSIDLVEQDADGDTALHCAVLAQKHESVSILLDAKSDPTLLNFRLFTPIHEAARIGFLPAVEQFNQRFPEHVNLKKDDGYTSLHLSSLNDHLDVVTALIEMEGCAIDGRTNGGQTALLLAVAQGHSRIVERLIGFGANMNVQDSDGDTALHLALLRESVDPFSSDTPQLKKVQEAIGIDSNSPAHASAMVACFLVQEGADLYLQNKKGHTPLQLCSADIAALVTAFSGQKRQFKFHGSLRLPADPTPMAVATTKVKPSTHKTGHPAAGVKTLGASSTPKMAPKIAPDYHPSSAPGKTITDGGKELQVDAKEVCFLCENPVNVRFVPCGHVIMCSQCAQRAKKCPRCKLAVEGVSPLEVVCVMCNEEVVTVTMKPCGHQFCAECSRRMKICFYCRTEILEKEGLPPAPAPAPVPDESPSSVGQSSEAPSCPICLTEPRNTALLCGHQLCFECASKVDHCPVCRKFITHRIRLFD